MSDNKHRKKILIVDDQDMNLNFLEEYFCKQGFTVEKAENGVEALERLERFFPDVILLDNIMPRMTGKEFVQALKSNPKYEKISIIMFSANDDVNDKAECLKLGVVDYIFKPANPSNLLSRIQDVLKEGD
jgi:DNA-binding response OmpR family regulator